MGEHVLVTVTGGKLRGKKGTTVSGSPLVSFQGVPYAKPPVGPLRFKPPQAADPWTGIRDALEEGPICLQTDLVYNDIRGEEDCLYLNVYAQELSKPGTKPVMVWIHGGGFMGGSGNRELYGVDHFVDTGVITVTINYRLGVLGFLAMGSELVPGNMGLKDQVAALRWVQQNITNFGGDPKNVTIFGESAGGASVHYLMLSPMSKGLFSKAIAQSGSALSPWAITHTGRARAFRLGELLGCKTKDDRVLLKHLMSVDGKALVQAGTETITDMEKLKGLPLPFVPTVEPVVPGQGGFLTRDPTVLLREGKFHQVPLIAGVTSHEGMLMLRDILSEPSKLKPIDKDFQKMVPHFLRNRRSQQEIQNLADKIRKFYFGNKSVSIENIMDYVDLNTDAEFLFGVQKIVSTQAALSSAPVYYYQFTFDGQLGYVKRFVGADHLPGACHGDELGYLFTSELFDLTAEPGSPEEIVRKKLLKLWTNFAKTGDPTPQLDDDVNVRWSPYTTSNPCYLRIDKQLSLEKDLEKKRVTFWNELYQSKL